MEQFEIPPFLSFTLTIILLFAGKLASMRYEILRRYSIPEPVVGGFLCAAVVGAIYFLFDLQVSFNLAARDWLLLYFFAGIGLKSDLRTLLSGGRPLLALIVLASAFILLQNLIGMGVAGAFGMDPKAGLMSGSIALTGGVGTTLAWAPTFVEKLGIGNAMELGVASNTIGLISACVIGGPIASYLIGKHRLQTGPGTDLDIGVSNETPHMAVDSYGVLWAWLWLNVSLILGYFIDIGIKETGAHLPMFVSCLIAGIFINNLRPLFPRITWPGRDQGLALISDISLGMFLTMALMSLQIWELRNALLFLAVVMTLQILLSIAYTLWIVFRTMGRDYEAAVICAGFGGITLGSTATAIVNMTAVAKQYGAAHRAFILVPLVCGFFIDLINAVVISNFVKL
jgi:ESS family glutamate:Na+ symporter